MVLNVLWDDGACLPKCEKGQNPGGFFWGGFCVTLFSLSHGALQSATIQVAALLRVSFLGWTAHGLIHSMLFIL